MSLDYTARIAQLRAILDTEGVDAIALVPGTSMVYFTGIELHLSERPTIALFTRDGLFYILPRLENLKLVNRPDLGAQAFLWGDEEGHLGAFTRALDELGLRGKKLGVDGMTMRVSEWLIFANLDPTLKVHPVERALTLIRAHKQPDEIAAFREAIAISERALGRLMAEAQPGMTEQQIAARLNALQAEEGSAVLAFESLVQTGENSANPHGSTTDRVLQAEDFLLIDFGCKVNGYPADITRTFCLGTPTAEMQTIYDLVLAANRAAVAVAAPGVPMGRLDHAAREVITAGGYGEYFTHRTGHGLGLDGHEPIPQIAANVPDMLETGMMFTIEPGIYVPGLGGVRIEDNVLVTETGLEVLTQFPRTLRF